MSEDKKIMDSIIPECVETAIGNVLEEPSKAMGETIANIWHLVFGGFNDYVNKQKIKRGVELEKYREECEKAVKVIPEDKLILPDIQKIAAILEASKYCIDKAEMRKMFAKLLSSSMNKDTERYVQVSFGSILSQLVPDEAKILMTLPKKSLFEPLVDININKPEVNGFFTLNSNVGVLGYESNCEYPEELPLYVDNLIRLGLVTVPYERYLVEEWRYAKILNSEYFQKLNYEAKKQGETTIIYKMIGITEMGETLRKLCK